MANTGNGVKDQKTIVYRPMEAASMPSMGIGKKNTGKIANLTPGMALEILQDCIRRCQDIGVSVRISARVSDNGKKFAIIVLENVEIKSGKFTEVQAE